MNQVTTAMIQLTIDGRAVSTPAGSTILEACKTSGIKIPTLCHLEGVSTNASCGLCVVEVEGAKSLVRSCVQAAAPGMKIRTGGARVMEARRTVVELLLANHPENCLSCLRNGSCELQSMAELLGVRRKAFPRTKKVTFPDRVGWAAAWRYAARCSQSRR